MTSAHRGVDDPLDLLGLEPLADGLYSGRCIDGALGRIYGGHTIAHTIIAAAAAGGRRPVTSVHVGFVRPGAPEEPVVYRTRIAKAGRSLDIVSVQAEQYGTTTVLGFAAMHEPESGADVAETMPAVPGPEGLVPSNRRPARSHPGVRAPFDIRYVPPHAARELEGEAVWIRTRGRVDSTHQPDHAALLAFATDFLITRAAHLRMPRSLDFAGASLDHAMWFHRPFRADEWLLVWSRCSSFAGSRSHSTSMVFNAAGDLVATAAQEGLLRAAEDAGRR